VQGNGVLGTHILGKLTLEEAALLACPVIYFPRLKHPGSGLDLVGLKVGPWGKRYGAEGFF
jgi:hypothetical protein